MTRDLHILRVSEQSAEADPIALALSESPPFPYGLTRSAGIAAAVEEARRVKPDVVLLDLPPSEIQGPDTLGAFLWACPEVPIIALADYADRATAAAVIQHGAQDCVGKREATGAVLWRSVHHAIERHRIQSRYQVLLDNMTNAVAVYEAIGDGDDFVFVGFNRSAERAERLTRRYVLGRGVRELFPGIEQCGLLEVFRRVWRTGRPERFPAFFYQDDRIAGWRENYVYRLPSGEVVAIYEDVTERKQAEAELLRRTALLNAVNKVFEQALTCDRVEQVADVCLSVAEEITGSEFGFVGRLNQAGRFDTLARSRRADDACAPAFGRGVGTRNMEVRGLWGQPFKDGRSLIANAPSAHPASRGLPPGHPEIRCFLGVPFRLGGEVVGLIALANKPGGYHPADAEAIEALSHAFAQAFERQQATQALHEQGVFLEAVLDSVEVGIVACDANGSLTTVNRVIREAYPDLPLPLPPTEWPERFSLYLPDGTTKMTPEQVPLFRALTGEHLSGMEVVSTPKGGPALRGLVSGRPIQDKNGNPLGAVVAVHDITERVRTEEALRKKEEQLRQAQKLEAVGTLAGGIAHEFNNLLQVILGYTRYVQEGVPPEGQAAEDLKQVLEAADRARILTRQLLDFSRRQAIQPRHVAINDLVRDFFKLLRPLIGEHIDVKLQLDEEVGVVLLDPGAAQQLLLNLCINARDAMPSGGEILLKTKAVDVGDAVVATDESLAPGRYAVLSIADTGSGMSPEVKARLFEPFFTTKEVGKGTGLGLPAVYGIVRQHGGAVHVDSEVGQGTTFKVFLPIAAAAEHAPAAAMTEPAPRPTPEPQETILLAEDEPMVRELATRILEGARYRVLPASDGAEAVRLFEEHHDAISLVLLDAVMPELSGHEVHCRIRESHPNTKVVFSSGYDRETAQAQAISRQNLPLIQKPFDAGTLLRTVREVLDGETRCPMTPLA